MAAQPDEPTDALVPVQHSLAPANLFGSDPVDVIERASAVATALGAVIEKRKLYKDIQGRKHVLVEGWTLLGSMLGVFPKTEWTRELEGGWEARVVAVTLAGQVVGSAESMCTHSEGTWAKRDEYALRSMAQTRATSKAMRQPLGFVMQLAGYEATPADEMPSEDGARRSLSTGHGAGGLRAASPSSPPLPVARVTNPITIKRATPEVPEGQVVEVGGSTDNSEHAQAPGPGDAKGHGAIAEASILPPPTSAKTVDADTALRNRAIRLAEDIYARKLRLPTTDPRVKDHAREALDIRARDHFSGQNFGQLSSYGLESLIDLLEKAAK